MDCLGNVIWIMLKRISFPYKELCMNTSRWYSVHCLSGICLLTILLSAFLVSCSSEKAATEDAPQTKEVVEILDDIALLPSRAASGNGGKTEISDAPLDDVEATDISTEEELSEETIYGQSIAPLNDVEATDTSVEEELSEETIYGQSIASWHDVQDYQFPLIAAIPEENIYLYATKDCLQETILFVGDISHSYNIPWITPRWFMPDMKLYDFDNDGLNELAIRHYYGSGTGISIWGLTIIEINESTENSKPWAMYTFAPEDYIKQVNDVITYSATAKSNSIFEISIAGNTSVFDFADSLWDDDFIKDIGYGGDIAIFSLNEDGITLEIAISAYHKNWATPDFFGSVFADVTYSDGVFTLSGFSYMSYHKQDIEKIRPALEKIDEFAHREIIKVSEYGAGSELFLLQTSDGFWFDEVYLVRYVDNEIIEYELLTNECVSEARFVSVGEFDEYFVEYYYSTHMGNGGMVLHSLDPEVPNFDFFGVYDAHHDHREIPALYETFHSDFYSFVFKGGFLKASYAQPYNDEVGTVTFRGTQQLLGSDDNILHESECVIAYIYDSETQTMVLSQEDSVFPDFPLLSGYN